MSDKVLFIDRDGTLIEEPEDFQVDSLDKIRLVRGVMPALIALRDAGYRLTIVSNQDGLGTDSFPEDRYRECQEFMLRLFESQGIRFADVFVCPHLAEDGCDCRKPRAGLLTKFLASNAIDTAASAVIGDRETDIELAERIGVTGYRLGDGHASWAEIVEDLLHGERTGECRRETKETRIRAAVNLDSSRPGRIDTGIGFFDHMLEQISKHGGFRLELDCDGDLEIDEHHTVEDTAIALGTALRQALGDKRGVGRYGFVLPMDESEARVSIDLSGRGAFVFEADFPRDRVGGLSTEMVEHFFRSLAETLGAAIHLHVTGENTHHMVEACFKSVGRALRSAVRVEGGDLPSTKGVLA